ncbi:STAS domain-containing protein [Paludibacterium purpuratum]|uniref:Phospholipid transport system transporter-binding protein n=1 Tax=Paludibacterium purpuratum TaxID=1144873 RepID=A0A4R7AWU8_9NEIS|nr:STAS domain-containing protein [Paludibacterium purpuratum]TDR70544.1 phospholipid transport system transporter-binding protein [Paludibacterium purpuratum]
MQIKLEGRLDMDRCGALARELAGGLKVGEALALDFSGAATSDSAALALILELRRTTQEKGASLTLRHLPRSLATLAALYGIETLIDPITESP